MTYDIKTAEYTKEIVSKYISRLEKEEWNNRFFLEERRLACQLVISKIENWLYKNSIKNFKVTITEYSDLSPRLNIDLPYKDKFDSYGIYFDRKQYIRINQHDAYRLWLPYEWTKYLYKTHKKNDEIINKLKEEFTLEKISLMLNYPFIMSDYNDGDWVFKDCNNIT